ncbi:uncharacterized protein LOC129242121 [Anastrepha obliqua]|uniref:uncharacterized protein LOC129242121 n=1 Tax=Anastrepha obliqua TaxID=95512 RepID=UPI002409A9EC|nr:uncharacterized protein LOC129242121 [Anastrepha obliqua]
MAEISTDELKAEIHAILDTADLSVVSVKKVREQVEKKLNCSLLSRKKEFDSIVMDFINQPQGESESSQEEEEEVSEVEEVEKKTAKKRPQPTQRKAATKQKKRKAVNDSDSGSESDSGSDSDYEVPKKKGPKKKAGGASGGGGGSGRKSTGFTRPYTLSPELSALMGAESLPRHVVVKKVWAIIKERNLYDPKNKQFAICDDELMKVMKVKRFRTFGMLKHLKPHFLD